jgi:hypothetical protein
VTSERWVLLVSSLLMWVPCVVLLLAGAPLLVGGILAISAGGMTGQVIASGNGTRRFTHWAAKACGTSRD